MYGKGNPDIQFSGLSFRGKREKNEDNFICLQVHDDFWFFAVADGVGGSSYGEYASRYVVNALADHLIDNVTPPIRHHDLKRILLELFELAQYFISEKVKENPGLAGMKTTLSILLLLENRFVCGNIGDSPIFSFSGKNLVKITNDHTFQNESNFPNQQKASYNLNVLTRVIDGGTDLPDIYPFNEFSFRFNDGQTIALCSDGVFSDSIKHFSAYKSILSQKDPLENKNLQIIEKAYEGNSSDNISVILISKGKQVGKPLKLKQKESLISKKTILIFLISSTILLIMLLLFLLLRGETINNKWLNTKAEPEPTLSLEKQSNDTTFQDQKNNVIQEEIKDTIPVEDE